MNPHSGSLYSAGYQHAVQVQWQNLQRVRGVGVSLNGLAFH